MISEYTSKCINLKDITVGYLCSTISSCLLFANVQTSCKEQTYFPALKMKITYTCKNKIPCFKCVSFVSEEDVWMSTGNVSEEGVLSWTGPLLGRFLSGVLQEMMVPFIDSSVDPPPIQAKTNKIQVQVTMYAQRRTLCRLKSLRFVHTSCWFRCKCISCKLSLSTVFYWRYFSLIFWRKCF